MSKLSPDGSQLVYSSYLGGTEPDQGVGVAVDGSGAAYLSGYTGSPDFPTANALQPSKAGGKDGFVAKINPEGSALLYSTYLGGNGHEYWVYLDVDEQGSAYVTGRTAAADFPTVNALQEALAGGWDAFVAKLAPDGLTLLYSTYLGGSGDDWGEGIAVDGAGSAHVTGRTASSDFPLEAPLQAAYGGGANDAYVARLTGDGSGLLFGSYLGGSGEDVGYSIAVDGANGAYVAGGTDSRDFPLENPLQPELGGTKSDKDAFAAKIEHEPPAPPAWEATISYSYDPLYRLTAADYSTGEYFHYTYDAVGKRLTQETHEGSNVYAYDIANPVSLRSRDERPADRGGWGFVRVGRQWEPDPGR